MRDTTIHIPANYIGEQYNDAPSIVPDGLALQNMALSFAAVTISFITFWYIAWL